DKKEVRSSQCRREISQLSSVNSGLCTREKIKIKMNVIIQKRNRSATLFKVNDIAAIKIDKVDKTSPLHPNVFTDKVLHVARFDRLLTF
ncbi:hypothetical protein pdam_00008617, partial [Pocillopora damicornis]